MKGKILISSPSLLSDMIFYKSIILIVDETDEGHTGFILNRPGGLFLIKNKNNSFGKKYEFNFGGPVSQHTFYIIRNHNIYNESLIIDDNLYWGNDVQLIIDQVEDGKIDLEDVLFFQGYSGWETEQLNDEIESNSWIVIDRLDKDIFDLRNKNSWNKIINELDNKYKIWSNSPDDISLN